MAEVSDLHNRLRSAREQAGLSQGQVAKLLDYHRPTISEIEAGRRKVTSDEIVKFANLYGVTVHWLLDQSANLPDPSLELAARELSKLGKEDLDRIMKLLKSLKKGAD